MITYRALRVLPKLPVSALYFLLPLGLFVVSGATWAFYWACKNRQFDDLASPPWRILFDDKPGSDPQSKS